MPTFMIKQVASELQVSDRTVRNWIKQGKLKVVRLGHRTVRITQEELDRIKQEGLR